MTTYGPGYEPDASNTILAELVKSLGALIEDVLAGATPATGSVTDAHVATGAGIAQSKIAGLVDDLATKVARGVDAVTVPDHVIIGHPDSSVPDGSKVGLEARLTLIDPNSVIQQHFVGFTFISGTPGPGCGSLQGGSCEASVFNNGAGDITPAVLGFEGIGAASGDNGATVHTVIGISSTAFVNGQGLGQSVTDLISLQASGPRRDSGVGSVTNAYSLRVQEPLTGANRFAAHITGRTRLVASGGLNVLELFNTGGLLQFAHDGSKLVGFISDGVTPGLTLDPQDGAAARLDSDIAFAGIRGLRCNQRIFANSDYIHFTYDGVERFRVGVTGAPTSAAGMGVWGHAAPVAQPPTPVTLADVIGVLQSYGLAA